MTDVCLPIATGLQGSQEAGDDDVTRQSMTEQLHHHADQRYQGEAQRHYCVDETLLSR